MDDQEKTLVERLEIWIDKPENWIKVFPCVCASFCLWFFPAVHQRVRLPVICWQMVILCRKQ